MPYCGDCGHDFREPDGRERHGCTRCGHWYLVEWLDPSRRPIWDGFEWVFEPSPDGATFAETASHWRDYAEVAEETGADPLIQMRTDSTSDLQL